jgi:outer membrane protein OmpA-like peptidoglycan-associated protein
VIPQRRERPATDRIPARAPDRPSAPRPCLPAGLTPAVVLALQRSAGNARVAGLLTAPARATVARDPLAPPEGGAHAPLPGWGDPSGGDDESQAAFDTSGSFWRDGAGMGPPAVAHFDEDEGFSGTLAMRGSGEVRLIVNSAFVIDEIADSTVTHQFSARWRVTARNKWGDLNIEKGRVKQGQTHGLASSPQEVQLTTLESEEQGNDVLLKATFTGSSRAESRTLDKDRTYAAPTKTFVFRLRIRMEGAHFGPRPGPYRLHPHTIYYRQGKHLLDGPQVVALADFLKSYPNAYEELSNADAPDDRGRVRIAAYASPKGTPQDNLNLAQNRAEEVVKRLTQLGVRPANITHPRMAGELSGQAKGEPPGNEATPSEQRVEILLPEKQNEE